MTDDELGFSFGTLVLLITSATLVAFIASAVFILFLNLL